MLKKANKYLILHRVHPTGLLKLGAAQAPHANPQYTRREVTGEEAMAFLRNLTDATGYEIYELKGSPLILQTTVVVAKEEDVLAETIGQQNAGDDTEEHS